MTISNEISKGFSNFPESNRTLLCKRKGFVTNFQFRGAAIAVTLLDGDEEVWDVCEIVEAPIGFWAVSVEEIKESLIVTDADGVWLEPEDVPLR